MIDDETLDRQLREAAPYIDDDGFTARVMARLPAAQREPRWLRAMILLGLAIPRKRDGLLAFRADSFVKA